MWPLMAASMGGNVASSVVSGIMNQNSVNQQENFQRDMSNTAYQRSTADMKAAGLNPAMMYGSGGGASTPSGGAATWSMPQVSMPDIMAGSNLELAKQRLEMDKGKMAVDMANTTSDTDLKRAQTILQQKGLVPAEIEGAVGRQLQKWFPKFMKGVQDPMGSFIDSGQPSTAVPQAP